MGADAPIDAVDAVAQVVAHVEADRERAARHLHDEPLQELCASLLRLQVLQRGATERQAEDLGRIIDSVRAAVVQLQDLQTELFPTGLELLDLESLVREDIARIFPDRAEPSTASWVPVELGPAARLTLLRLLREVHTAAASAGATPLEIKATGNGETGAAGTTVTITFGPTEGTAAGAAWIDTLDRSYLEVRARTAGGSIEVDALGPEVRVRVTVAA
jgi:signal transduction histidine kinase